MLACRANHYNEPPGKEKPGRRSASGEPTQQAQRSRPSRRMRQPDRVLGQRNVRMTLPQQVSRRSKMKRRSQG